MWDVFSEYLDRFCLEFGGARWCWVPGGFCVFAGCAQLPAWSSPVLKGEHTDLSSAHHCLLKNLAFSLATLGTVPISPHLPISPLPHQNSFFGFSDSHLAWLTSEPWDHWLGLLLLRSLQALQTSTKLWAFSQFTYRFIICWHCFSINRSTFTDFIDSTASLLTNSLFNVSNCLCISPNERLKSEG